MAEPMHVVPVGDFREHKADPECWCHPDYDDGVYVHHAMDRREQIETGERLVH